MRRFPLRIRRWWILGFLICLSVLLWFARRHPLTPHSAYFSVTQRGDISWLITPDGKPFFSLGVNVVDRGVLQIEKTPGNLGYAAYLHYPNDAGWADATRKRLKSWEFNTVGGWSDVQILNRHGPGPMPYTVVLQLGLTLGMPWDDPFGPEFEQRLDALAREQVLPLRDDPQLVGWFTDNELNWYDQTIFAYHVSETKPSATRRVLMKLIRDHYQRDFQKLGKDFDPGAARSFADLETAPTLRIRPGENGAGVINEFMSALADRYYRCMHDAIRRYDSHHLILGDRYRNYYCPAVARASAPYVDVVSTNYYCRGWDDGDLARFFVQGLHQLTGKPVLISEYYFCATENRSGDGNSGDSFPTVATQGQRAAAFEHTLQTLAASPYVVGAHWFQYYDEPPRGRRDGENFNMGLVDIHDNPYEQLTAAAARVNVQAPQLHANSSARGPALANPAAPLTSAPADLLTGWNGWDKARSFVAPEPGLPFADLYACTDGKFVYLAAYASDFLDPDTYTKAASLESEQMELTIRFKECEKPLRIRFGPAGPAHVKEPIAGLTDRNFRMRAWEDSTRYSLLVAIADAKAGDDLFVAHGPIEFQASLSRHDIPTPMRWKATIQSRSP